MDGCRKRFSPVTSNRPDGTAPARVLKCSRNSCCATDRGNRLYRRAARALGRAAAAGRRAGRDARRRRRTPPDEANRTRARKDHGQLEVGRQRAHTGHTIRWQQSLWGSDAGPRSAAAAVGRCCAPWGQATCLLGQLAVRCCTSCNTLRANFARRADESSPQSSQTVHYSRLQRRCCGS